MPLTKIEFAPGLVKDETALSAEGGYIDAEGVRFRQGKPETRGGWEMVSTQPFQGIARGMHAWSDLRGQPQLAWGTANKAYVLTGGSVQDITPAYGEGTILNPFTTVSGSPAVSVKIVEHGLKAGQSITFANAAPVGGLTLNGTYTVTSVETRDTFTITAGSNATSAATGGGGVDWTAAFPTGLQDGTGGIGYGTGTYGTGVYGLPNVTDFLPAVWSIDNFGETLLLNRRGGPLYAWQPATQYPEIMRPSQYAGGTGWTTTATGGSKTAGTASNLSQNIKNAAQGGYTYRVTFTATVLAGSVKIQVNAGTPTPALIDVGAASTTITQSGTYSRLIVMPANPSDLVFAADGSFAGSISNVSLKLESKAFQIPEAPRRIDGMFVDPHRTVVLFATYEADGDYNPLLLRNSALENFRIWIPDNNNFAGEIAVASGGRIVGALASRNVNLVFTDAGLHAMAFSADGFSVGFIAAGCGLMGRHAAVEHNGIAYWLANDGTPYRTQFDFQGAIPQRIDCRIKSDIDHIAPSQAEKVFASVNTEFAEVQWFVPDDRIGTECNRALVYQIAENHWTSWTEARSSWVPSGVFVSPIACGTDGYLYYHERGITANGNPLPNFLEAAYFDVEDGGNLMRVNRFVCDFQRQTGEITLTIFGKLWPNAVEIMQRVRSMMPGTRKVDFRLKARQIKFRLSASTPWRGGLWRIEADKDGARR